MTSLTVPDWGLAPLRDRIRVRSLEIGRGAILLRRGSLVDVRDGWPVRVPPQRILQQPPTEISACKLFYVHDGRNAWHSTWVQRYFPNFSFQATFQAARAAVERARKQGSSWSIVETPALVVRVRDLSFVTTEINTDTPLGSLPSPDGFLMEHIVHPLRRASSNVLTFVANEWTPLTPLDECRTWKSESSGGGQPLQWLHRGSGRSAVGVMRYGRDLRASLATTSVLGVGWRVDHSKRGVQLLELKPWSPMALQGFRTDDVVTSLDLPGATSVSWPAVATALSRLAPGRVTAANVDRGGEPLQLEYCAVDAASTLVDEPSEHPSSPLPLPNRELTAGEQAAVRLWNRLGISTSEIAERLFGATTRAAQRRVSSALGAPS